MGQISDKILKLIDEMHISYGDLSKITGIPKSAIQRYATGETGKIPMDRIELLATALNTTPAYLMGWSDSQNADHNTESAPSSLTEQELAILTAYRNASPEVRAIIDSIAKR